MRRHTSEQLDHIAETLRQAAAPTNRQLFELVRDQQARLEKLEKGMQILVRRMRGREQLLNYEGAN